VASCCECGDEPSGSLATEIVNKTFGHLNIGEGVFLGNQRAAFLLTLIYHILISL
jgi:hypothetical protein